MKAVSLTVWVMFCQYIFCYLIYTITNVIHTSQICLFPIHACNSSTRSSSDEACNKRPNYGRYHDELPSLLRVLSPHPFFAPPQHPQQRSPTLAFSISKEQKWIIIILNVILCSDFVFFIASTLNPKVKFHNFPRVWVTKFWLKCFLRMNGWYQM